MTRTRSSAPSSSGRPARLSALRLAPDSLGFALDAAAQAVDAVRRGTALPAALAAVFAQMPADAQALARGATQDVAYRTMRRLGSADWLIGRLVGKAPPAHVQAVLAAALALLLDPEETAAYPAFTIVDQAVTVIGARREFAFAKGLVNAVLRRFQRERDALVAALRDDPVARWNYRPWWIDAVKRAWPDTWQAILAAGERQGPLTLRVNARRASVDAYLDTLRANGIDATAIGRHAVRLASALPVNRIPGFADGVVSVQDAGAQLAAEWLGARDGMRVLDACAAPGGKTGHILELAGAEVVALESDATRAARIGENLARLSLAADVCVGDAGAPDAWYDGRPFDRILADVPCTAAGVVRRHPDIKWLRREADIEGFARQQSRILDALWGCLARGGALLYVTCSIFEAENEAQVAAFVARHADALRETITFPQEAARRGAQLLPSLPGASHNQDGYFYALLRKP